MEIHNSFLTSGKPPETRAPHLSCQGTRWRDTAHTPGSASSSGSPEGRVYSSRLAHIGHRILPASHSSISGGWGRRAGHVV